MDSLHVVERLVDVSHRDWKHSQRLDLTDEGTVAELAKPEMKGARQPVLGIHRRKHVGF